MKIDVQTLEAKKAGTVDLTDEVFALEPRADILHRMVAWQLAKRLVLRGWTNPHRSSSFPGKC